MWTYGPPQEEITVSFIQRIRCIEDHKALFLLENASAFQPQETLDQLVEYLGQISQVKDFQLLVIITTKSGDSQQVTVLLDCRYTDSVINTEAVNKYNLPTKSLL